jgi:hypothetical protein
MSDRKDRRVSGFVKLRIAELVTEFESGFPAARRFAREFAAAGDAGESFAILAFAERLEGSTGIKRLARAKEFENFFVGFHPFHE